MPSDATEAARPTVGRPVAPRGQVLIIFAFLLTVLLGAAAFVVDLAWIWSNQLQVQRAADAGALAGVVHLPGDPNGGVAAAKAARRAAARGTIGRWRGVGVTRGSLGFQASRQDSGGASEIAPTPAVRPSYCEGSAPRKRVGGRRPPRVMARSAPAPPTDAGVRL